MYYITLTKLHRVDKLDENQLEKNIGFGITACLRSLHQYGDNAVGTKQTL